MTQAAAKASVVVRCLAKAADFSVVLLLNAFLPVVVGALLGFIYMLVHDGMFSGQSIGKRLFRLKVMHVKNDLPCTIRESAVRNAPLGVATFFAIIPFWGWILAVLVGIPLVAIEIYLMVTRPGGHRLGDVMADTVVVEAGARPKR